MAASPAPSSAARMRTLLKWCVSALLIGFLLYRTPLSDIGSSLARLDWLTAAGAFVLTCIAWWLSAVRLAFIAPEFGMGAVVRMTLVGLYYGTVLPGQLTGDFVKAYRLSPAQRLPGRAAAVVLVDRVIAMAVLFALGAVTTVYVPEAPRAFAPLLAAGAVAIALGVIAVTSPFWTGLLARWSAAVRIRTVGVLAGRLATGLLSVRDHPWGIAANCAAALAFHVLCVAIHVMLGHALAIELSIAAWAMIYACVSLLLVLPVSIAGVGLREGGYVGLLALFGVPASQALSLSFVFLAFTMLGALFGSIADARGGATPA